MRQAGHERFLAFSAIGFAPFFSQSYPELRLGYIELVYLDGQAVASGVLPVDYRVGEQKRIDL